MRERVQFRIPFKRYFWPLLIEACVAIGSGYLLTSSLVYLFWIGVAGMGLVVFTLPIILWSLLDFRPEITMGPEGFKETLLNLGPIPWCEIREIEVKDLEKIPHLCLTVDDPNRFLLKASWFSRFLSLFNRFNEFPPISINLVWMESQIPDILDQARAMKARYGIPDEPPTDALHPSIPPSTDGVVTFTTRQEA